MTNTKEKKADKMTEKELAKKGIYKGYDMRWLRETTDHPDFSLVEEYDKKYK